VDQDQGAGGDGEADHLAGRRKRGEDGGSIAKLGMTPPITI
jgi:hypothetical protein